MPLFGRDWTRRIAQYIGRQTHRRARFAQDKLVRQLRVMRLEDRRVLNGDAVVQQLFVDAGAAANDGHADTYHIQEADGEIRISLNGEEVNRTTADNVDTIEIRGSSDDDTIIAKLQGRDARQLDIRIDGNGGHDRLQIDSLGRVEKVIYELGATDTGRVQIESDSHNVAITYSNIETIDDHVSAGDREFRTSGGQQAVTIDDTGSLNDGTSRLEVRTTDGEHADQATTINFVNPHRSLAVDTQSTAAGERDTIEIKGLDERFAANLRVVGSDRDSLTITERVEIARGDFYATTGDIRVFGHVTTHKSDIDLESHHGIVIGDTATIHNELGTVTLAAANIDVAGQIVSHAGHVAIDSGEGGVTVVRGRIDVSGRETGAVGGTVHVLGATVVLDGAAIDAAGFAGGGAVLIGGDYQGKGSQVRNATQTFVGAGTSISANAEVKGTGGKVVVWANESTQFYGRISSRGGRAGGDGGLVEVSGRENLVYRGSVELTANHGKTGTLLLDPAVITIIGGNPPLGGTSFKGVPSNVDGTIRFDDSAPATVYETEIELQSATANIILEASQTIRTLGNFIDDAVTLTPNSSLTLRTRNNATDGAGEINLTGSDDKANLLFRTQGAGTIAIEASTTGGAAGNISIGRLQSDSGAITVSTFSGNVSLGNKVTTSGDLKILALGNVTIENVVEAQSIVIAGTGDFNSDATVNAADYQIWRSTFGSTIDLRADANGNGVVDTADYVIWRNVNGGTIGTVTFRDNVTTSGARGVDITATQIALDGLSIDVKGVGQARFNGPTVLEEDTIVKTAGGNIGFASTVNSQVGEQNSLTLAAGAGNITFVGAVGGATGGVLGPMTIQSAARVNITASTQAVGLAANVGVFDASAGQINTSQPTGGAGGDVSITATGLLSLNVLNTSGGNVHLNTNAPITLTAPINAASGNVLIVTSDNLNQNGTGVITAAGLALKVGGTATLRFTNDVDVFAANNGGTIDYNDVDGLTVAQLTLFGTTVTGITTTNDDVRLLVGDVPAENLAISQAIALGDGNLMLDVAGDVSQAAAGTISAKGLALIVDGTTTLAANNNVAAVAAMNDGTLLLNDIDGFAVDKVTVLGIDTTGITTSGDDVKLITGDNLVINQAIKLNGGDLLLDVTGNVTQTGVGTISASGLALLVDGTTTLGLDNNVGRLAANNGGTLLYKDADLFDADIVDVLGMSVSKITTTNDDVKLTTGGKLTIRQEINLGAANLFLDATGGIEQVAPGTIVAAGLALKVTAGNTVLPLANNVFTIAADTGRTLTYNDINELTIGEVTVLGMGISGITTTDNNVRLIVGDAPGENLTINRPVALGSGNFLVEVAGNLSQTTAGRLTASGLALKVGGTTTLPLANSISVLAANTGGTILYRDADGLDVGEVTTLDISVAGITTTGKDAKLVVGDAVGENLAIMQPIALGAGNLLLDVAGNVSQAAPGNIQAVGLALMIDGTTTFNLSNNNVITLAADNGGTTHFIDFDTFAVGDVTVLDMTMAGLKTTGDDVKLVAGANLSFNSVVALGAGNLLVAATGNVSQLATGTIIANGLAMMVGGTTTLGAANDVDRFAADNGGTTYFNDRDGLSVDESNVLGMSVTLVRTNGADVKLVAGGDVAINKAISLGSTGNLLIMAAGNVSQDSSGATITARGLALMAGGSATLSLANNVMIFAASTGGLIHYIDSDGLIIGELTIMGMNVVGITTTDDDVKLVVGDATNESLSITRRTALGAGDLLLDVAGDVTQTSSAGTSPATITAAGLALMVDGRTTLELANDVHTIAADDGGTIIFNDVNALNVGDVNSVGMPVSGIRTTADDVKLIVGENLTITRPIDLRAGDLFLDVTGNLVQTAAATPVPGTSGTISSAGLALMVDGTTLFPLVNNVGTLAADDGQVILFNNAADLTVGAVAALDGTPFQMTVTGIKTSNDDVKLVAGGSLSVVETIAVGAGDLMLAVTGNASQSTRGNITATGLALMVSGSSTFGLENNIQVLAADNGGTLLWTDVDGYAIGEVMVLDGSPFDNLRMTVSGIKTTGDDVKLVAGGDLAINRAINLTDRFASGGNLFLKVTGNVSQVDPGTITAAGLGLMVSGNTTLDLANNVAVVAANNGGTILYRNAKVDGLSVGEVTALGMETKGIKTSDDDVKLIVRAGESDKPNLSITNQIELGTGTLFLDVAGNVAQSGDGTIAAVGLGLMVDGDTTLNLGNAIDTLAANVGGTLVFRDVNSYSIGEVTVFKGTPIAMPVTGVTTPGKDAKLIAGSDIMINQPINLGAGNLLLMAGGNVTQNKSVSGAGTITAKGLALMVQGHSTLMGDNDVVTLAADNKGSIQFHDTNDVTTGEVTVLKGTSFEMTVRGVQSDTEDVLIDVERTLTVTDVVNLDKDVRGNDVDLMAKTIVLNGPTIASSDQGNDGGLITFHDAVELMAATFITASAFPKSLDKDLGGVLFKSAVVSSAGKRSALELAANDGDITFEEPIGSPDGTQRPGFELGKITIVSARNVTAKSTVDATSLTQQAGTGTTRLTTHVRTQDGIDLLTNSAIVLGPHLATPSMLTLSAEGHEILLRSNVTLDEAVTALLDTTGAGMAPSGANIEIVGSLNGTIFNPSTATETLQIGAGDKGSVKINTRANAQTGDLVPLNLTILNSGLAEVYGKTSLATVRVEKTADRVVFENDATITELQTVANSYNMGFRGTTNTIGAVGSTTATKFLNGGMLTLGDGPTSPSKSPDTITFRGGVDTSGGPQLTRLFATIQTLGGDAKFGTTQIAGASVVKTGNGLIQFSQTLDNDSPTTTAPQSLTLDAGTGDINFLKAIGATRGLADLTIELADDVSAASTIRLLGNFTVNEAHDINTNEKVDLTGNLDLQTVHNVVAMGVIDGKGNFSVRTANDITTNSNVDLDGNLDFGTVHNVLAKGPIALGGDMIIGTAADVTAEKTINLNNLRQRDGTGKTTFQGDVTASSDINIKTDTIELHGLQPNSPLQFKSQHGTVTLETYNVFNLESDFRPIDLDNVRISTSKGSISDNALQKSGTVPNFDKADIVSGAFGALELSKVHPDYRPIQGSKGLGQIIATVADELGSDFVLTFDWSEGDANDKSTLIIPVEYGPTTKMSRYVYSTLPTVAGSSPKNTGDYEHSFTTPPDVITEGSDVPVFVSVTEFAGGTIQLMAGGKSLLVPPDGLRVNADGTPNGIQFVIELDVKQQLSSSALPSPAPLPAPPIPPPPTPVLPEAPLPLIATPLVLPSSAGAQTSSESRYYELRIVTLDANGHDQELTEYKIDLTNPPNSGGDAANDQPDSIYPFHPGKFRELFRRLPDDHYRIYLIENGTERLMLDFTIRQGRPVEVQEELPPDQNSNQRSGEPTPNAASASPDVGAAQVDSSRSRLVQLPTVELPPNLVTNDIRLASKSRSATFAQNISRAAFVAPRGVFLSDVAIAAAPRAQREAIADQLMASFGRDWRLKPAEQTSSYGVDHRTE